MITLPYDPVKNEITIDFKMEFVQTDMPMVATFVYDTEAKKYITMDSILYDEVKNNVQRYISYRPKIAISTTEAFNYPQFIAEYVNELNSSMASPQQALTAEAAIILKLSEYKDYVESGHFLIYDIFKLTRQGGGENAER
ncbi:MAG: hypothetical protein HFH89_10160 [Lachnospiraceae bacterium]|nr:hypothetical protein [Lachnospiraceae bacterium]